MSLYYLLSYTFSVTTILIITFILFAVKPVANSYSASFQRIKYYFVISVVLELFNEFVSIMLDTDFSFFEIFRNNELDYIGVLINPIFYAVQLFLVNKMILELFHAKSKKINKYFIIFIPLLAIITFALWLMGTDNQTISYVTYGIVAIFLIFNVPLIVKERNTYFKLLENMYSEDNVIVGKYMARVMYPIYLYFLVAIIDIIVAPKAISPFMIIYALIYTSFVVKIMNAQGMYIIFDKIEDFGLGNSQELVAYKNGSEVIEEDINDNDDNETKDIGDKIKKWELRNDKPYTKEGINLSCVADDIKISPVKLSFFLNNMLDMNFNIWINNLRIEESKHIITNNVNLSFIEISTMVGFTDSVTFSKTFKKITGVTPSVYKKNLNT